MSICHEIRLCSKGFRLHYNQVACRRCACNFIESVFSQQGCLVSDEDASPTRDFDVDEEQWLRVWETGFTDIDRLNVRNVTQNSGELMPLLNRNDRCAWENTSTVDTKYNFLQKLFLFILQPVPDAQQHNTCRFEDLGFVSSLHKVLRTASWSPFSISSKLHNNYKFLGLYLTLPHLNKEKLKRNMQKKCPAPLK